MQHIQDHRDHPAQSSYGIRQLAGEPLQLSERERQVMTLIAKGMQVIEVARLLDITANTVCTHVKSIYRKRGVSSRAEAALEAKRLGLV